MSGAWGKDMSEYGVDRKTMRNAVNGVTWSHVE